MIGTLRTVALLGAVTLAACSNAMPAPNPPGPAPGPTPSPTTPVHEPVLDKELMITDLSVVNDARAQGPDGPWSFGGLIKAMAGTSDPGKFAFEWLKVWETNQPVNTFGVKPRTNIRSLIIEPWKVKDGKAGIADAQWTPNLGNAPFRLLAIVDRLDLSASDTTSVRNAGEGRFVFGVLNAANDPVPFTVIFEYEQLATDRPALRSWAQEWHALGGQSFGPAYNSALQAITDKFSGRDRAPAKPNGSPLNQIRTNEIALVLPNEVQRGWELREFQIVGGKLQEVSTRQTPDNSFQNTATLAKFINDTEADILDRNFEVPVQFAGAAFLAGSSIVAPPANGFFWRAPGVTRNEARHIVAFTSCSGCHHLETGTTNFLHVANRRQTEKAELSGFLTGIQNVPDPLDGSIKRNFNDLLARATILKTLASEVPPIQLTGLLRDRRSRVH
jgi:hypothetical protein